MPQRYVAPASATAEPGTEGTKYYAGDMSERPSRPQPRGKMQEYKQDIRTGWYDFTDKTWDALTAAGGTIVSGWSNITKNVYKGLDKQFPGRDYGARASQQEAQEIQAEAARRDAAGRLFGRERD